MPPRRYLMLAFAAGAASAALATIGELALGVDITAETGAASAMTIVLVTLVAPVVEECVKPLGVFLIQKEERPQFQMKDWAMLGLFAGLGFALLEDFLYATGVLSYGWEAALALLGMRLLLPLHLVASTLTGIGIGMYQKTGRPLDFAVMLVPAICLHALFNFAAVIVG
ncbi:MAG: PrsW family glutamic-type intramembrane protease [Methanobacteriota archaeon]